jgi:branched-subunit amino acid ABC-type transport system permease component
MSIALTHLASLISSLPMALDGEAESANSAGLGVVSVVSIGITYVVLFALWFFVFRDRSGSKRKKDSSD